MLTIVPWVTGLLLKIIENVIILFAICYIYIAGNITLKRHKILYDIIAGVTLGAAAIFIMFDGFVIDEASNFVLDTRSIIFSVAGLFFGPLAVAISSVLGILYRIFVMGGASMWPGSLIILVSAILGLSWKYIWKKKQPNRLFEFYVFGFANAVLLLLVYLSFFDMIQNERKWLIIPFVLGLFPLFTLVACLPLSYQKNRFENSKKLEQSELMLQSSIDSAKKIEIFSVDTKGFYISFNKLHAEAVKCEFGTDIHLGDKFPMDGSAKKIHREMNSLLSQALNKETVHFEDSLPSGTTLSCSLTPLTNSKNEIIGVTVIMQDITEQKKYESIILEKSYRDGLTGFSNRRFFNEKIADFDAPAHWPLVVIMADINDLKLINDGFGHETGDRVIIEVTKKISLIFKDALAFFRTGGDEFLLFVANSNVEAIKAKISDFNAQIKEITLGEFSVSVAFGTAVKDCDGNIQETIKQAEKEMYENKFAFLHKRQNYLVLTIEKRFFASHPLEEQRAKRISEWAVLFGRHIGLSDTEIKPLKTLARLHEIGKIGLVPAEKTPHWVEPMNPCEISKKHVEIGYQILSASGTYSEVALDVLSHHERFDGKGYPCGLSGEKIPFRARILALLSYYDECLFPMDGKPSLDEQSAIEEIKRQAGTLFDPKIVSSFISALADNHIQTSQETLEEGS